MKGSMNEKNKRKEEWKKEYLKGRINETIKERMNERIKEGMNERKND